MFRWIPWLFDFQYMLFMYFAPTRWLSRSCCRCWAAAA